jgi:hypothetical protein
MRIVVCQLLDGVESSVAGNNPVEDVVDASGGFPCRNIGICQLSSV